MTGAQEIDLSDSDLRARYADQFGVTETALLEAASLVGRMPVALEFYFKSKTHKRKVIFTAADRARVEIRKAARRAK